MKKAIIAEVGIIRILVVLLQLVFLKIYTNHTSVYELGIYYFLFTVSYSLNAFLLVPLDYFQQSQLYKLKNEGSSLKSFFPLNKWVLKATGLLLAASLLICYFIDLGSMKIIPIITLIALSTYFVNLLRGLVNNLEKRRAAIYTLLSECILKIGFYYLYAYYFGYSAYIILISLLSASVVTLAFLLIFIRRTEEYKSNVLQQFIPRDIIEFSYPISIAAVINWIQLQGYRMILVPLGLVEIVGIYGTVANVGTSGMSALSTIYSQLFIPNLYKSNGDYLKTYMMYAILSICGVLGVGYFMSDFIIALLTKSDFVKFSSVIVFGIISEGGNFLISALTVYLTIHNLTKITIISSITGLVAFVVSFGLLYLTNLINVYTVGIPIIFTQLIITIYLAFIVKNSRKLRSNA